MNQPLSTTNIPDWINIRRYGLLVATVWTLFVSYSLLWDHHQHKEEALLLGKMQGQAFYEKDILYRSWASSHGGVYVPVTETTQPSQYLSHVPERDITTSSGKQLTLINPAYMTRQVFELAKEYKGTGRGHITSLNPIRPENAPDPWEKAALQKFEQGVSEVGQIEQIDGKPYYRYMKSFIVDKPCLKCHQAQGYREGDVRGGLSVSVAMEPIYAMMAVEMRGVYLNHAVIWLLGICTIGFGTRKLTRITTNLYEKTNELELENFERRQAEEAIRLSEDKFSRAFENAPIIMTISRLEDGIYLDVNRKFNELSGFNRDETIGNTSVKLGWMTAEQQEELSSALHDGTLISGLELNLLSKEGKSITCIFYGETISVYGRPCLLLLAHDVTEYRVIENQLRQSQKMEAIGQLAGGVAHDFNNILTVIMGYCSLLQSASGLDEFQRESVIQIEASSERAAQLTSGLLMFSRKEVMELRKTDLNHIVLHVEKFLTRIIGEDIHLKVSISHEAIPVRVDASQIEQVLINLTTNARDAMETGGVLSIDTCIQNLDEAFVVAHGGDTPGQYACITVTDTGSGMDTETCKRVFEPFFTTKAVGKGTGLGMAIVYGIVNQHKGFIDVYSNPGNGTTFSIYLPVFKEGEEAIDELTQPETPIEGSETILLAEDEAGVRQILNNILTKYGYTVILAEDGQDAVDKFMLHRESVSLVLLDMIMPHKNGQEALTEIKRIQPGIKALYLSGYTHDFLKNRGINSENIEIVTKPLQQLVLLRKIRAVLGA